ncbi:MAG: tRNA (adenosine(37)-N6)-threonylcarbamoyltransferase complex dimerization subunit type 1 TsaB [Bacteroidales bacterium]|nr:tRNA (adenosine(37)-N6)-threonylcarbamoyltransferase complex dimerization subunit type 1 TsaB [Bacteroidales bacterium]
MIRLVLIETATACCSVALSEDARIVSCRESEAPRAHAAMTAPFIEEMLREQGWKVSDCDAVCLSMGPGSYTGLRVGSSTAKGLCFGAGIPLLAVDTPAVLVAQAQDDGLLPADCRYIVPMVDARRMEVYAAVHTADGARMGDIAPVVVTPGSFARERAEGPVLFIGDGAAKCAPLFPESVCVQTCPRASAMLRPALHAFRAGLFRDIAYFEPFYLKQFVATVSRKALL